MKDERLSKTKDRPTREGTRSDARPARVPINGDKNILTVTGVRPDYHPCWVNEAMVPRFLDAGYTFVDNDVSFGTHHVQQANPLGARYARNVGMGVTAYLMEIPQKFYDEDRDAEEAERKANESTMRRTARSEGLDHGDLMISRGRLE